MSHNTRVALAYSERPRTTYSEPPGAQRFGVLHFWARIPISSTLMASHPKNISSVQVTQLMFDISDADPPTSTVLVELFPAVRNLTM